MCFSTGVSWFLCVSSQLSVLLEASIEEGHSNETKAFLGKLRPPTSIHVSVQLDGVRHRMHGDECHILDGGCCKDRPCLVLVNCRRSCRRVPNVACRI